MNTRSLIALARANVSLHNLVFQQIGIVIENQINRIIAIVPGLAHRIMVDPIQRAAWAVVGIDEVWVTSANYAATDRHKTVGSYTNSRKEFLCFLSNAGTAQYLKLGTGSSRINPRRNVDFRPTQCVLFDKVFPICRDHCGLSVTSIEIEKRLSE